MSTTWYVDSTAELHSIIDNNAVDGDTIVLDANTTYEGECEGTVWHYAIDPKGKNVVIRSEDPNDPNIVASTIISPFCPKAGAPCGDAMNDTIRRSCNFADSNEDPNCQLIGFTILTYLENEFGQWLGCSFGESAAVLCTGGSSPTIDRCVFKGDPNGRMDGIDCNNSGARIKGCTFSDNRFASGAIHIRGDSSNVTIEGCDIVNNVAVGEAFDLYKQGIYQTGGDVDINNCTISGNEHAGPYAGIFSEVLAGSGDANVTITDCNISGNTPRGVYCGLAHGGQITVKNCTIANNTGGHWGAGINIHDVNDGNVLIEDCDLTGNSTITYGGAIHLRDCYAATIKGCTITGNSATGDTGYGGGICVGEIGSSPIGPVLISNCVINDNKASQYGGGIESWSANLTVENCTISGNSALNSSGPDFGGGGISSWKGLTIKNCEITGNKALNYGGGIELTNDGDSLIRNCTIADNFADTNGGGIYIHDDIDDVEVKNCVLWGNQSDGAGDQVATDNTSLDPNISYSDGQGCGGSDNWQWDAGWDGVNNIDVNPWFVGPGYWVDVNRALSFDGNGDYVDVGDPNDDSLDFGASTDFSVSLWFKTSMSSAGFLVNKKAKGYTKGYDTYIQNGQIWARIGNTSIGLGTHTTETFNDNDWHHVAVLYDRDDVVKIYVDDVNKASSGSISAIGDINNSQDFVIGDRKVNHAYFDGKMDDVRVYDKVLSVNDISDLYQNGPTWSGGTGNLISRWEFDGDANDSAGSNDGTVYGASWTTGIGEPNAPNATWESGDYHLPYNSPCIDVGDPNDPNSSTSELDIDGDWRVMDGDGDGNDIVDMGSDEVGVCAAMISHWKFEEGSGTTAADSVSDNNGTLYGGPNWVTGRVGSYALDFNGTSDYVDVGDQDDLDFGEEADFTIIAWFKTSSSSAQMIVNKRAKGVKPGYDMWIQAGKLYARISDSSSGAGASTTATFNDGSWHNLTAVYDRSDVVRLYVDANELATPGDISGLGSIDTAQVFTIGDRNDAGWHAYFNGDIDDVIVFDRCLTAEEVKHLYQYAADYCY